MQSVDVRLRQELDRQGWSIRKFQRKIEGEADDDVRGVSYASVHEYITGKTEPPLSWLRSAASLLGVSLGWLVSGEGDRLSAGRAANDRRMAELLHSASRVMAEDLKRAERIHLRVPITLATREAVEALVWAYADFDREGSDRMNMAQGLERVWEAVTSTVEGPMTALGLEGDQLTPEGLEHYVRTTTEGLRHLLSQRQRRRGRQSSSPSNS